jgi:hypothetical protein
MRSNTQLETGGLSATNHSDALAVRTALKSGLAVRTGLRAGWGSLAGSGI